MRVRILNDDERLELKAGEEYETKAYWLDPEAKLTLYDADGEPKCNVYREQRGTTWERVAA